MNSDNGFTRPGFNGWYYAGVLTAEDASFLYVQDLGVILKYNRADLALHYAVEITEKKIYLKLKL